MKTIALTQGYEAVVDEIDFKPLSKWKWCYSNGYAVRSGGHNKPLIFMHRVIIGALLFQKVDHKNRDRLDNRQSNLRVCTLSQNSANQGLRDNNTSGYKGVYWDKTRKKWRAQICVKRKQIYLGIFDNIENASHAYNKAANLHFGAFAFPNS